MTDTKRSRVLFRFTIGFYGPLPFFNVQMVRPDGRPPTWADWRTELAPAIVYGVPLLLVGHIVILLVARLAP